MFALALMAAVRAEAEAGGLVRRYCTVPAAELHRFKRAMAMLLDERAQGMLVRAACNHPSGSKHETRCDAGAPAGGWKLARVQSDDCRRVDSTDSKARGTNEGDTWEVKRVSVSLESAEVSW